jgi:hypothetical protein
MMRCPFEIGESVIYIADRHNSFLTKNKEYVVCEVSSILFGNIGINSDNDAFLIPNWEEFITKKEYRKKKLDKVNKKSLI